MVGSLSPLGGVKRRWRLVGGWRTRWREIDLAVRPKYRTCHALAPWSGNQPPTSSLRSLTPPKGESVQKRTAGPIAQPDPQRGECSEENCRSYRATRHARGGVNRALLDWRGAPDPKNLEADKPAARLCASC